MHKEIYKQNTNQLSQDRTHTTIEPTPETMDDGSAKSLTKKRSREQLEDLSKKADMTNDSAPTPAGPADAKLTADGEPEKKKHRDNSQELDTKTDNVCPSLLSYSRQHAKLFLHRHSLQAPLGRQPHLHLLR
jgi:hypothetical protein